MNNDYETNGAQDKTLRNQVMVSETVKENYRIIFKEMSMDEMRKELRTWKDDDLTWLCEQVALPTEDYEICQCVNEVMKERGLK